MNVFSLTFGNASSIRSRMRGVKCMIRTMSWSLGYLWSIGRTNGVSECSQSLPAHFKALPLSIKTGTTALANVPVASIRPSCDERFVAWKGGVAAIVFARGGSVDGRWR